VSISDEPPLEVVYPPSDRLDSSSVAIANDVVLLAFDINAQLALRDSPSVPPALRDNCDDLASWIKRGASAGVAIRVGSRIKPQWSAAIVGGTGLIWLDGVNYPRMLLI
jgi:hypothetical protein